MPGLHCIMNIEYSVCCMINVLNFQSYLYTSNAIRKVLMPIIEFSIVIFTLVYQV